ncbi:MAG: DUF4236 domain-containing protein [Parvibaculum sp.]|jgi:hypothetical protein|uniref:DUF4236 domain-containing protein n=1 Tax=Parvibaculum sp. TaxID=2024848 RepID=UPI000DCDBB0F|nr:DUF4236 domain-containing protein [Parvibaculum sp.]MDR3499566.1 DUF4236 domain-containing protein [Parvibaculum sp.]RAV91191.1 DUF4236 domain-containing protein [Aerococcus tenax]
MGFRFRKSLSILPGVKINLSKTGGSLSLGGRGASVNLGRKGVKTTVGLPGSGMSYSEQTSYADATSAEGRPGGAGLGRIVLMILAGLGFAAWHYFTK